MESQIADAHKAGESHTTSVALISTNSVFHLVIVIAYVIAGWRKVSSMSDISAVNEEPFEVREASEGKGLGCFATRDIKAGETVLVTHSWITWTETKMVDRRVDAYIALYDRLDEEEKRAWAALAASSGHYLETAFAVYLRMRKPLGGRLFTVEEQEYYLHLMLALENNCFEMDSERRSGERAGLFIQASRFNHSCDPNVHYTTSAERRRWVGRATRDIRLGEELTISYLPLYHPTEERQASTMDWGFKCLCDRCRGAEDTYTASLAEALFLADKTAQDKTEPDGTEPDGAEPDGAEPDRTEPDGTEPDRTQTYRFGDSFEEDDSRLRTRIALLRELVDREGDGEDSKWRRRELVHALWDASQFRRHWLWGWLEEGAPQDAVLRYLTIDTSYCSEALAVAQTAWPANHEMVRVSRASLRGSFNIWRRAGLNPSNWPGAAPAQAPAEAPGENPAEGPDEDPSEAPAEAPARALAEDNAYDDEDLDGDTDVEMED
ncbi:hypothetical protein O1611_g4552 [Lasiodiplodia mahajangana]|uniref:Uncharacterized protein n=1 Tax=Lasiodiplodia mahajangana TaxID=1108764 RepID=A0ACC2JNL1_9PEZI|nr:hypothetical protein O1611_g4552 [Lasiodiplodia mahajangana]